MLVTVQIKVTILPTSPAAGAYVLVFELTLLKVPRPPLQVPVPTAAKTTGVVPQVVVSGPALDVAGATTVSANCVDTGELQPALTV